MKRDMDLVRKILLQCEKQESGFPPEKLEIEGYSDAQIGYHVHLMGEAGLLHIVDRTHMQSEAPEAIPLGMTWEGHEFLDAARSETVWEKAKGAASSVGSVAFGVLKNVLTAYGTAEALKHLK